MMLQYGSSKNRIDEVHTTVLVSMTVLRYCYKSPSQAYF